MANGDEQEISINPTIVGDEPPGILKGQRSKMPPTPDISSFEGIEAGRTNPFLAAAFGSGTNKG
jgi:hypothetical protein